MTELYFYDERAPAIADGPKRSPRAELEIADLNEVYLAETVCASGNSGAVSWLNRGMPG